MEPSAKTARVVLAGEEEGVCRPAAPLFMSESLANACAQVQTQETEVANCGKRLARLRRQLEEGLGAENAMETDIAEIESQYNGLVTELSCLRAAASRVGNAELSMHLKEQAVQYRATFEHELRSANEVLYGARPRDAATSSIAPCSAPLTSEFSVRRFLVSGRLLLKRFRSPVK